MNRRIKQTTNFRFLLLYFFLYAFIGWILETIYGFGILGHFTKRGFLFGPLCPIYGFGAVILISCLKKYKSNSIKLFCYSAIVFSVFEYVAGFALDALFAGRWWDYTNDFFNLNGRISLFYSFAWGIIAILFINNIHPFIERHTKRILKKIPIILQTVLVRAGLIFLLVDLILSSLKYLTII